jgi:DNA polymerase-3 subunit gamma/tau
LLESDAITALTRELALQSQLVGQADAVWTIEVSNPSLNQASTRDRLQAALSQAGHAVQLQVRVGPAEDTPARRHASAARERLAAAEATLLDDPFVQAMMRDFGGKMVPGSVQAR